MLEFNGKNNEKKDAIITSRPSMWLCLGVQKLDEKRLYFLRAKAGLY
jgi:hypothetical protein